jgi:hypothetical protein
MTLDLKISIKLKYFEETFTNLSLFTLEIGIKIG